MGKFARNTTVNADRTLIDIQSTLRRYGASKFGFTDEGHRLSVGFEMQNRRFRFTVPLPEIGEFKRKKINQHATMPRTNNEMQEAREQAVKQRWRALLLVVKAKLESVESGIETLEQAFMAQLVLPNGQTVSEWAGPQVEQAYLSGKMPPLLPSGS